MLDLDFWKQSEIIGGLLVLVFTSIWGLVKYFERRGQARVDRSKNDLKRDADARVGALETQISSVAGQVSRMAVEVRDVEGRVVGLERTLETVARTKEVNSLAVSMARLEATTTQLSGKMDTLYRAAIEAGTQPK